MSIIKADITYDDNSEATFTGNPLDLSTIPAESPNAELKTPQLPTSAPSGESASASQTTAPTTLEGSSN